MAVGTIGKRKAERRICDVRAQIQFRNGREPIDCTIVDLLSTGARIRFKEPVDLPGRFSLHIPSRSDTRIAIVRWVSQDECGVEYSTGNTQADEEMIDLVERVEAIERALEERHAGAAPVVRAPVHAPAPATQETHGIPPHSLVEISKRIDDIESAGAEADAALEAAFTTKLEALRASLNASPRRDESATNSAPPAEILERIARLEQKFEKMGEFGVSPLPARVDTAPNRDAVKDFELRLSALERIAAAEPADSQETFVADVVERINDFDRRMHALEADLATAAPSAGASDEVGDLQRQFERLEMRLDDLTSDLDDDARAPRAASPVVAVAQEQNPAPDPASNPAHGSLDLLYLRVSNMEVDMLNLKYSRPQNANPEYEARLARLEQGNRDIQQALKDVLAMLVRQQARTG